MSARWKLHNYTPFYQLSSNFFFFILPNNWRSRTISLFFSFFFSFLFGDYLVFIFYRENRYPPFTLYGLPNLKAFLLCGKWRLIVRLRGYTSRTHKQLLKTQEFSSHYPSIYSIISVANIYWNELTTTNLIISKSWCLSIFEMSMGYN